MIYTIYLNSIKMGFIYNITNTQSGKLYIGETSADDPDKRWKKHFT